jgi:hypothetical protein
MYSAAYAVAVGVNSNYCKISGWGPIFGLTTVGVLCFDSTGNPVNTQFIETYQGPVISPF